MSKGSLHLHDKSQVSRRSGGLESIGSLLSVSISDHSNASSNSIGRRHSLTGRCHLNLMFYPKFTLSKFKIVIFLHLSHLLAIFANR